MCTHSKFASKVYESIDVEVLEALHSSRNKHRFRASGVKIGKGGTKSMEGARLCFLTSSKAHSIYGCCDLEKDRKFGRLVNIIVIHHAFIFNYW